MYASRHIIAFALFFLLLTTPLTADQSNVTPFFREGAEGAGRVVCMVPARVGSTRLALKNLRLLGGRFLCEYAMRAAALSGACDRVVLNADFDSIRPVVDVVNAELLAGGRPHTHVEFYRRPKTIDGHRPADDVVADIMEKFPEGDLLLWVNPTSPLQIDAEVRAAAQFVADRPRLGALIGAELVSRHVAWQDSGEPVNFDPHTPGAKTQTLRQIAVANYCVIGWRYKAFLREYRASGAGYFAPDVGWMPANKFQAVVVKTAADLHFASLIMTGSSSSSSDTAAATAADAAAAEDDLMARRAAAWAYDDVDADVKTTSVEARAQISSASLAEREARISAKEGL